MIHPDVMADVAAARGQHKAADTPPPGIEVNETIVRASQQARTVLHQRELVALMAQRFVVTNLEGPPAGCTMNDWMLYRAGQASVLEWLYQMAALPQEANDG